MYTSMHWLHVWYPRHIPQLLQIYLFIAILNLLVFKVIFSSFSSAHHCVSPLLPQPWCVTVSCRNKCSHCTVSYCGLDRTSLASCPAYGQSSGKMRASQRTMLCTSSTCIDAVSGNLSWWKMLTPSSSVLFPGPAKMTGCYRILRSTL